MSLVPGSRIGPYEVIGLIGEGGMGQVYRARDAKPSFGNSLLLHDTSARVTVVVLMNQGGGADHFVLAPALLEIALRP